MLHAVCITDSRVTCSMHYRLTCYTQYALQTHVLHAVCITDSRATRSMHYRLTCYTQYALQTHVLHAVCMTDSRVTCSMHYRLARYMQYALQTCASHAVCITDSRYVIIQDQAVVAAAPERESRMGHRRRRVGQRKDSDPGFGRAGSHPPGSGELLERCDFWEDHSAGCVMTSEVKIVIPVSFW